MCDEVRVDLRLRASAAAYVDRHADLADHPILVPILEELLGDPRWGHAHQCLPEELRPKFRLDHHNIHYRAPLSAEEGAEAYKNGAPHLHGGAENCGRRPLFERSLSYRLTSPPMLAGHGSAPSRTACSATLTWRSRSGRGSG